MPEKLVCPRQLRKGRKGKGKKRLAALKTAFPSSVRMISAPGRGKGGGEKKSKGQRRPAIILFPENVRQYAKHFLWGEKKEKRESIPIGECGPVFNDTGVKRRFGGGKREFGEGEKKGHTASDVPSYCYTPIAYFPEKAPAKEREGREGAARGRGRCHPPKSSGCPQQ